MERDEIVLPSVTEELNCMLPDSETDLIRTQYPQFRATAKCHSMVIQNRRHDECTVQDPGYQERVLKLRKLIAEAAVRRVPHKPLSRAQNAAGTAKDVTRSGEWKRTTGEGGWRIGEVGDAQEYETDRGDEEERF